MQVSTTKHPTTQTGLAVLVRRGMASDEQEVLLFDSIRPMIIKKANTIIRTAQDRNSVDMEDIFQGMFAIIKKYLRTNFNPDKSGFTTWVHNIIRSKLLNVRLFEARRASRYVTDIDTEKPERGGSDKRTTIVKETPGSMNSRASAGFRDAILTLLTRFPQYERIIIEVFGDPTYDDYVPPLSFSMSAAAANVGMKMPRFKRIFRDKIVPVLKEYMAVVE